MHLLLHLVHKVKLLQPLHCNSCDDFEMLFAKMLNAKHGGRGASFQIIRNLNVKLAMHQFSKLDITNPELEGFCNKVLLNRYSKHVCAVDRNTALLGKPTTSTLNGLFNVNGATVTTATSVNCYPKCVFNGQVYKTSASCESTQRIDCYLFVNNRFYVIFHIANSSKSTFFLCKKLAVQHVRSLTVTNKLELRYPLFKLRYVHPAIKRIDLSNSIRKCCTAEIRNDLFLLPLPTALHLS